MKHVVYNEMELGFKLDGVGKDAAVNFAILKGKRGGMRIWTTGGQTVVVPPSELRALLAELIKMYPLDALGAVADDSE